MFPRGVHYHVGAVLHVLKFAMDMGFHDIIIEGPVASCLKTSPYSSVGGSVADMWIDKVVVLQQRFNRFEVSNSSGECNGCYGSC